MTTEFVQGVLIGLLIVACVWAIIMAYRFWKDSLMAEFSSDTLDKLGAYHKFHNLELDVHTLAERIEILEHTHDGVKLNTLLVRVNALEELHVKAPRK